MNDPIQIMLDEHETISRAEHVVESLNQYWETSEDDFKKRMVSLIKFFREYSDKYHHYKEEQVLFPVLENLADFATNSIVAELNEHHDIFRGYTASIEDALEEKKFEQAYKILTRYIDELLDHIAVENDELFVMTESLLSESELESMYFKFKDIDSDLGEAQKLELVHLLDEIEFSFPEE